MKRWPIIRHVRWWLWARRVKEHYDIWRSLGFLPINAKSDYAALDRIWRGEA